MNVLMIMTSNDRLGDSGNKTGFWLEEFAAPFYTFRDAAANVTLASPAGGTPPIDPNSLADDAQTDDTRRFNTDDNAKRQLAATKRLVDLDLADYDAVFYPGGHGPLWDLVDNRESISLIESYFANNKPVAAVCHGPAVFVNAKAPSGQSLVAGKRVTAFSDSEEAAIGLTGAVPFLLESRLRELGAKYSSSADFELHCVIDGSLITGQNPASSREAARAVVRHLSVVAA